VLLCYKTASVSNSYYFADVWSLVTTSGTPITAREFHSTVLDTATGTAYTVGGSSITGGDVWGIQLYGERVVE